MDISEVSTYPFFPLTIPHSVIAGLDSQPQIGFEKYNRTSLIKSPKFTFRHK